MCPKALVSGALYRVRGSTGSAYDAWRKTTRSANPATDKPHRFVFVLLDEFTMLSLRLRDRSLRIANRMLGQRTPISGRSSVRARDEQHLYAIGTVHSSDSDLPASTTRDDTVMFCGGIDVQRQPTKKVMSWLRREARKGVIIGGLCTAAYTLAKAGLLDGKRATIHWENQDSFAEEFEDVTLTKSVFVVDGNRMTTAGGTASIDLMLKLIARPWRGSGQRGRRSADLFLDPHRSGHPAACRCRHASGLRHPS